MSVARHSTFHGSFAGTPAYGRKRTSSHTIVRRDCNPTSSRGISSIGKVRYRLQPRLQVYNLLEDALCPVRLTKRPHSCDSMALFDWSNEHHPFA